MDSLYISYTSKRRRRKLFVVATTSVAFLLLFTFGYIPIIYNILIKGPYIATHRSDQLYIGQPHDAFDITFQSYPSRPALPSNITPDGHEALVPPIMHQISLGPKANKSASLQAARESCVEMHPGYQFMDWVDENSAQFVHEHFPDLYPTWSSYRYIIQKADSLRYMVLYHYGGTYIYISSDNLTNIIM
jgi:mannosyltransferase OCH1-like enzyme